MDTLKIKSQNTWITKAQQRSDPQKQTRHFQKKIVSSSADKSNQDYQKTEGKLNVGVIKFSGISIDGSAIEGASINGEDCGSG
ncbi:hypothetical protein [Synechococcus sp. WH 8020]|uniref:hypothetical protein n=1 Tax=Synechococcus sp. (strain WH8020) TaxID=32052 RepID=UPI0012ED2F29|nr:hypothetical protein [Synechococcus sp. WH 8020]